MINTGNLIKTYDCLIFYVGKMFKNVVFLW